MAGVATAASAVAARVRRRCARPTPRRRRRWSPSNPASPSSRSSGATGEGEVVLGPGADPARRPDARSAGGRGGGRARAARSAGARSTLWPAPRPPSGPVARRTCGARSSGCSPPAPAAIPALEALDQRGLFVRLIPEWAAVRNRPQRNAFHRFTVDRHLLEAASQAAPAGGRGCSAPTSCSSGRSSTTSGRDSPGTTPTPGSGRGRDGPAHGLCARGRGGPGRPRPQPPPPRRCRHPTRPRRPRHRRSGGRARCSDRTQLELLAALTEADSLATGPAAWGPWKAGLVADLVRRVATCLAGGEVQPSATARHRPPPWLHAPGRTLGRSVVAADAAQRHGGGPGPARAAGRGDRRVRPAGPRRSLRRHRRRGRLRRGDLRGGAVPRPVARLQARGRPARGGAARDLPPRGAAGRAGARLRRGPAVGVVAPGRGPRSTSTTRRRPSSTVVDVRAEDDVGLLHRITAALFALELDVVAARVSTLGHEVLDAFYVRDAATGGKVTDPEQIAAHQETASCVPSHAAANGLATRLGDRQKAGTIESA